MRKTRWDTIRNKILRKGDGVQNLLTVTGRMKELGY
jgi:hypothetical protein